jgi:hypothetical protein
VKEYFREYMKLNQLSTLFLLILVIGSSSDVLYSQNIQTKTTRQSSLEAFLKGNYERAYIEFSELLLTYSKDPLYKYYSGVCLVKLSRDPVKAVNMLQQALQSAAVVKTLPSDALFYLARAQQMSGKYLEATGTFNRFTDQVGKKTAKEYGVPDFVRQCEEKKGEVTEHSVSEVMNVENGIKEAVQKQEQHIDTVIKKNISPVSEKLLSEGLELQIKADSVNELVAAQKNQPGNINAAEKNKLRTEINENELAAVSFQKEANQKYNDAQQAINQTQEKTKQTVAPKLMKGDTIKKDLTTKDSFKVIQSVSKETKLSDKKVDTTKGMVKVIKKPAEVFAVFEVLPKPVTDPKEKIKINPEVTPGLIYRIQIAVFRNPVAPAYFKGITPIYGFKGTGTDKTIYYAGMFRRSSDANKALAAVKAKGFKDSFVVPFSGSKPVSADRAKIMEKEWSKKSFAGIVKNISETPIDTVPPTLSFRVEVIRTVKPLKGDIIEGIKKIAGFRGMDIHPLEDGNIVYLIGKFITFESAAEYTDLLIRNGYRDARVIAWLGDKEIPVEVARQLFDNLQ